MEGQALRWAAGKRTRWGQIRARGAPGPTLLPAHVEVELRLRALPRQPLEGPVKVEGGFIGLAEGEDLLRLAVADAELEAWEKEFGARPVLVNAVLVLPFPVLRG